MSKFIVSAEFWRLFPQVKIGVVVCRGIQNSWVSDTDGSRRTAIEMALKAAEAAALEHLTEPEFSENKVVKVWREAFGKFKTKKGARSSIEALLKRISNGNSIGSINPLVDLYNAVSLRFGLPCGGEDIDTFVGDLSLTLAEGTEHFVTLGSNEEAPPYPGELIYKDEAGAVCRCWNWRESVRTMLTEDTRNAFLCLELVDLTREQAFRSALEALVQGIQEHCGGEAQVYVVDADNPQVDLG